MKTPTKKIGLAAAAVILLLQGCASQMNPVGEAKFDCNRKQDSKSPYCRSFKSVDASTSGDLPQSRFDKEFNIGEFDRLTGISPDETPGEKDKASKSAAPKVVVLPHQVRLEPALAGAPVREGPVVQRVWVKRFVDGSDLLTENTVVYKEIKGTRWAGFDAPGSSAYQDQKVYPRRPADQQQSAPPQSQQQPGAPVEQQPRPAPTQSNSEFNQPGATAAQNESAFDPAVSGSTSMPK